ncbi:MAG: transcriptional regulator TdcA, partial [Enterobacter hormaechei]|nr:transcriptional regulator TdcA [Enterobacter hormaechei]
MLKRKHDKIINIMQLRFFCQVALRGSVSRAADDLFRTQSAITRAIRDLEAALNVTLFERHYSGMVPTEYGKCILPRARRAIDDLQAIPALLQKHHTRSSGPLADAGWLFNTRRLAIFIQLYHVNHTQTVAQQLGITQPAVSKIIGDMESYFGSELIVRRNTGVSLTEAGQVFLNWSEAITREMKNMVNEMNALTNSAVVDVSFGFPSLVGFTFMSEMVHQFKMTFPKARVSMYEAQLSAFLPAIRDGRLDFAIGTLSDEMKLQDLHVEPLFESEFVLVANRARIGNGTVRLASLQHEQWVLPETNM